MSYDNMNAPILIDGVARQIESLRAEMQAMSFKQQQIQPWPQALGQSFEKGLYNMSLSTREAAEKMRLAILWGAGILGISLATTLAVMVVCIWRIGR